MIETIKLYVLYAGSMICTDASQLNDKLTQPEKVPLANPIFLIAHPDGYLLWDTGLSDELIQKEEGIENWIFQLRMHKTVKEQLDEIGVSPDDIDYLAFSHMHIDHTGNANQFKSATLLMQEKEYFVAFDTTNKPYNYADYEALKDSKIIKINGDYDVFGDGSVQLIATPGHTAGHQSLLVRLEETGAVILSGDITYYQESYVSDGLPTFNVNRAQSVASLAKIKKLVKEQNAQLWIQHDQARFDSLKLIPAYYK